MPGSMDSRYPRIGTRARIDALRERCVVVEEPRYSVDYLDPDTRSIANAVQVTFADGSSTELVEVEFPLGHPRRRDEAVPRLRAKLLENLGAAYGDDRAAELAALLLDDPRLDAMRVDELLVALAR
jgi:2-methylcitrate dehydratase